MAGLCARHAVVRDNVAVDVVQLQSKSAAPNGAFWTATLPPGGSGPRCHQDLLFENNTVDSGPGPAFALAGVGGVSLRGNRVTQCDPRVAGFAAVTRSDRVEAFYEGDWVPIESFVRQVPITLQSIPHSDKVQSTCFSLCSKTL